MYVHIHSAKERNEKTRNKRKDLTSHLIASQGYNEFISPSSFLITYTFWPCRNRAWVITAGFLLLFLFLLPPPLLL